MIPLDFCQVSTYVRVGLLIRSTSSPDNQVTQARVSWCVLLPGYKEYVALLHISHWMSFSANDDKSRLHPVSALGDRASIAARHLAERNLSPTKPGTTWHQYGDISTVYPWLVADGLEMRLCVSEQETDDTPSLDSRTWHCPNFCIK